MKVQTITSVKMWRDCNTQSLPILLGTQNGAATQEEFSSSSKY